MAMSDGADSLEEGRYSEDTDCPICAMVATDRDDALGEVNALGAEIERLRIEVRRLHKLNGWSKQKGWWCSCGAPIWSRFSAYIDDDSNEIRPWSDEGRARVLPEHAEHVRLIVEGS